jgi:hypothetical protein
MTARVQLKRKSLVLSLKGLGVKTNRLAVILTLTLMKVSGNPD